MSFILADNANDDTIDIRDVIERFEELETELESFHDEKETTLSFEYAIQDAENFKGMEEEIKEFLILRELLSDLCGYGGDEQWRGDWYPITLINDRYFVDAMQELVQDVGDLPQGIPSYLEIDWEATAKNLQADYSSVEFQGNTFWYR